MAADLHSSGRSSSAKAFSKDFPNFIWFPCSRGCPYFLVVEMSRSVAPWRTAKSRADRVPDEGRTNDRGQLLEDSKDDG